LEEATIVIVIVIHNNANAIVNGLWIPIALCGKAVTSEHH
jgi:hypothetical protein